ncbi:helix-turn-helix transcriptional regulator [Marinilabilia salmonicolor]|uniref:helix-turn-helix transcriptional regulator n=1 Tax=Marinilabilia salmonicolor TaxID=989 RepID=UPI00029AFF00|nr:helix-turn-helix domain-containing protein [Marinilabilia salmonicolor]
METIQTLINERNLNVSIPVTPKDLQEFATSVAKSVLANYQPKDKDEEELLTVDEAMALLKISRTALWRWEQKEFLKPVKLGRFVRYRKSDIDNLIRKKEVNHA